MTSGRRRPHQYGMGTLGWRAAARTELVDVQSLCTRLGLGVGLVLLATKAAVAARRACTALRQADALVCTLSSQAQALDGLCVSELVASLAVVIKEDCSLDLLLQRRGAVVIGCKQGHARCEPLRGVWTRSAA